jgi:hypothetical protein
MCRTGVKSRFEIVLRNLIALKKFETSSQEFIANILNTLWNLNRKSINSIRGFVAMIKMLNNKETKLSRTVNKEIYLL